MKELPGDFFPLAISATLIFVSALLLFWYLTDNFNYWNRRGVTSISPLKSFLRTLQLHFGQKQSVQLFEEQYKQFEGHRFGGTYQLTRPSLLIRDPALIREILVKSFSSFHDRIPPPDSKTDQLSSGNLAQLTGEKWHQVRQKVSPAFSSSKLKIMHETLSRRAEDLNVYLENVCSQTDETELDVKELMSNYSLDVIGACVMGIKCNAIRDPDCEFKRFVQRILVFNLRKSTVMFLKLIHPKLPRFLGLRAIDPKVETFLKNMCKETMQARVREVPLVRKDFLQILMSFHSSELEQLSRLVEPEEGVQLSEKLAGPVLTEEVMNGIIGVFLASGYEPVASTLTFCLYELALHPDIQNKIFKEIKNLETEVGDAISFEDLKKFRYTEQVINETLRKYPVGVFVGRICTQPFLIPDSTVVVEKGVKVVAPIYCLHHDPRYFPEPDKFEPERFSDANIDRIVPGTYLPFGDGPRFCLAMRFALMDVKTMLIKMISNYTLHTCNKTPEHIKFDGTVFSLSPKGGLWLRLQRRR